MALKYPVSASRLSTLPSESGNAERAAAVHRRLLDEGTLIHRPAHPTLGHLLRISALDDALVPGRLDAVAEALNA